jgi:hypothetical protein
VQPPAADEGEAPAQPLDGPAAPKETPPPREQTEPALVAVTLFLGAMSILFLGSLYVLVRQLRRRRRKARSKGR